METVKDKDATEEKVSYWKLPECDTKFVEADLFDHIRTAMRDRDHDYELAIGTDSQIRGKLFRFITVLCIWKKGKGGTYYYKTEYLPRSSFPISNQKMRMFDEVARTIELALKIEEKTGYKPIVHVDASIPTKKEFTSSFSEQLRGYVVSCGYECVLKPESYVANCIADRHTKRKLRARDLKEFTENYGPQKT
ncbi:MAG: ribonuclease H-like YkuK family protein [Candidatus Paceibacterota bacterium]|jgi:hypothetical protein